MHDLKTVNISLSEPVVKKGNGFMETMKNVFVKSKDVSKDVLSTEPTMNINLINLVEQLTGQKEFLKNLEKLIIRISANNKFNMSNVPELIHLIVNSVKGNIVVKNENLKDFVRLVFEFVVKKYNLMSLEKLEEYEDTIESSVKLVLFSLNEIDEKMISKCFSCYPKN
jgi:hypothetical protein